MKNLNAAAQTSVNAQYGQDPILIVSIKGTDGEFTHFSDFTYAGCTSAILSVGEISKQLNILERQVGSVNVTLSTINEEVNNVIINDDVHQRVCEISLSYRSNTLTDRILLFSGKISSPFTYDKKEKSVSFDVLQEIEAFEVGFSPEESQLPFVSQELNGNAWPLGFGSIEYGPTVPVRQNPTTELQTLFCLVNDQLYYQRAQLLAAIESELAALRFWLATTTSYGQGAVTDTIDEYMFTLLAIEELESTFQTVETQLNEVKNKILNDPTNKQNVIDKKTGEQALSSFSDHLSSTAEKKTEIEGLVDFIRHQQDARKEATNNAVQNQKNLRSLITQFWNNEEELCNQLRCAVSTHKVTQSESFPQTTPVDVFINGVKFNVTFDDDSMKILSGPNNEHSNIVFDSWTPDDTPCSEFEQYNGINLVRTDVTNLTGKYLLIKKVGEPQNARHILKVASQEDRKVYLQLVPWSSNRFGDIGSLDLDTIVNDLVDPVGSNPLAWNRPESDRYLGLVNQLTDPTEDEKKTLAELSFLEAFDQATGLNISVPGVRDIYTIIANDIEFIEAAAAIPVPQWFNQYQFPFEELTFDRNWQAEPGSKIISADESCAINIVNILPSTVKGVHAYRTNSQGERFLAPVPTRHYTLLENHNLGTINVTALVFPTKLSDIIGENWEDEVYCSYVSSVGPKITDILKHLINTYTDYTPDTTTFDAVETDFGNKYPANFVLLDRPNVLDELNRIAWESRCAMWADNGKMYIKYLSKEPTALRTLTNDDTIVKTTTEVTQPTEDLLTRIIGEWRTDYLPIPQGATPKRAIFRYNVKRYGLKSRTENIHIFNRYSLVEKTLTFWLIREGNTFREMEVEVIPKHLDLEIHDTVELANKFRTLSLVDVMGVRYDPVEHSFILKLALPVRSGETDTYQFYWPSSLSTDVEWPTAADITNGFAGGHGPGSGVEGNIPCS